ncbi:cytidylyltransferase domain-containing protein [Nocardiopsis flavescens]|uniref:acylneuraminate cytidylyltransferase family protein n=1 Tax=Nocardiopsis flavescens TaxID=758803 RepID=UPI00365B9891
MKAIIPAKTGSNRIPNKNFREFHGGRSLVDILVEKLLRCLPPQDIFVSSDDDTKADIASKWGVNFLPRDKYLAQNSTPMNEVVQAVSLQIPGENDIMWCQATEPLFDEYADCLQAWNELDRTQYDSLAVCYPVKKFMLDQQQRPIGFGFGPWHIPSQELPQLYQLNFTLGILSHRWVKECGYHVGSRPYWYASRGHCIDIDDVNDWELAQIVYERKLRVDSEGDE